MSPEKFGTFEKQAPAFTFVTGGHVCDVWDDNMAVVTAAVKTT